jgi:hypothetical protein
MQQGDPQKKRLRGKLLSPLYLVMSAPSRLAKRRAKAPGAFDIRFDGDATHSVNAFEILSLLFPDAASAAAILTNVAQNINIPGVDLTQVID